MPPSTVAGLWKGLGLAIAVVQLFDIAIHAATDQIEPLRVASNLIILLWLALVITGRINAKFMQSATGFAGAYFLLNFIFLTLEGVTNPAQGGALRLMLFLLIGMTVALATLLTILHRRSP